ncbi:MAG: NAD-dependent deacylase [Bacteroidales bacterium]|nr:NAD-dependent deacylase [Bacteroidales bacterium]
MKKLVVLTGAGISAESGIKTFRDHDGLWENYRVEDVATYDAWLNNPSLVLDFYNQRRTELGKVMPNQAHLDLAELEKNFDVHIITQNVDNLHERAGSSKVLHLHGELCKVRGEANENEISEIGYTTLKIGDKCSQGSQLRPHIVWFGEAVPKMEDAVQIIHKADIVAIIGTSMQVYPAASLIHFAPAHAQCFYIDPSAKSISGVRNLSIIAEKATVGVAKMKEMLTANM